MNQTTPARVNEPDAVTHATFTVERTYPVPPARAFTAFADQATKRRWFAEGRRLGGVRVHARLPPRWQRSVALQLPGRPRGRNDTQFQFIIPDRRIVFSYRMTMGARPLSASLSTVELVPFGAGTHMTYSEQGVYFDGPALAKGHEEGSRQLMERLAEELGNSR